MTTAPCDTCPVRDGECYPRRSGVRRLCEPAYRASVRSWGAEGGPPIHAVARRPDPGPGRDYPDGKSGPPAPGLDTPLDEWAFVTEEMLLRDARRLFGSLPGDIGLVVGVVRSGMLVAAHLATWLHVPLRCVSRAEGVTDPGHGSRLADAGRPMHVLLVDDTAATGREMRACRPLVEGAFPGCAVTTAAIYAHPQAAREADLFVRSYPGQHYLAWNWCNAGHGQATGFDFDGILCGECPAGDDDDGPRYLRFLETAPPLYLPRRSEVPLVVTARHEKYRGATEDWLAANRVRAARMIMRDFGCDPVGRTRQVAEWKAGHYARSDLPMFAESEPEQARIIAEVAGKPVLCPAAGRVFPGRPFETATVRARREAEEARAWYSGLPAEVKGAADRCVRKEATTRTTCCGTVGAARCVGGPRDGEFVDVLACARCKAADMGV